MGSETQPLTWLEEQFIASLGAGEAWLRIDCRGTAFDHKAVTSIEERAKELGYKSDRSKAELLLWKGERPFPLQICPFCHAQCTRAAMDLHAREQHPRRTSPLGTACCPFCGTSFPIPAMVFHGMPWHLKVNCPACHRPLDVVAAR